MPVFLYIDATSGGILLQVLLSGVVGALVIVKLFWGNLLSVFRRRRPSAREALAASREGPEQRH